MSIRAINWARELGARIGMPQRHRFVLMMICFYHHDKTGECFPSYETIAKSCGFSRRKVIDLVSDIEKNGLIVKHHRRVDNQQSSNSFVLFGTPNSSVWVDVGVHKKAPPPSAPVCTLVGVPPFAHDKACLHKRIPSKAVGGGRV